MLPRSLFSASTLKIENNEGGSGKMTSVLILIYLFYLKGIESLFSPRSSNSAYSVDHVSVVLISITIILTCVKGQRETPSSLRSSVHQLSSDSSEDEEEGSVIRRENNMIKIPDVIAQLKRKV